MCDFYGPMAEGMASPSAGAVGNEEMAMPDMDALLDQLEREEGETCEKQGQKHQQEKVPSPIIAQEVEIKQQSQETIVEIEEKKNNGINSSENVDGEKTTILINSVEMEVEKPLTPQPMEDNLFLPEEEEKCLINEMANKTENEEQENGANIVVEESGRNWVPSNGEEILISLDGTKEEKEIANANVEDDLFEQIDQMDALIRAEEEKLEAKNLQIGKLLANKDEMEIGQNVPESPFLNISLAPSPSSSSMERFVEEMVGRLCGQAVFESQAQTIKSQNQWGNARIGGDFYAIEPPIENNDAHQESIPMEYSFAEHEAGQSEAIDGKRQNQREERPTNSGENEVEVKSSKTQELEETIVGKKAEEDEENKSEKMRRLAEEFAQQKMELEGGLEGEGDQKREEKEVKDDQQELAKMIREEEGAIIREMDEEKEEGIEGEAFGGEEGTMEGEWPKGEKPKTNNKTKMGEGEVSMDYGDKGDKNDAMEEGGEDGMEMRTKGDEEGERRGNEGDGQTENLTEEEEEETTKILQQLEAQISLEEEQNDRQNQQTEELTEGGESSSGVGKMSIGREEEGTKNESKPSSSSSSTAMHSPKPMKRSHQHPLTIVHDLSVALDEFKLTESELTLGKRKPNWIPDDDCPNCMLCSSRFSLINRRHHCRACGRVLCRICCSQRRQMGYMDEREGKQRVCVPCNRTLDRIEEYEKRVAGGEYSSFPEPVEQNLEGQEQQKRINSTKPLGNNNQNGMDANLTGENGMEVENGAGSSSSSNAHLIQNSRFENNAGSRKTKSLLKPPRLAQFPNENVDGPKQLKTIGLNSSTENNNENEGNSVLNNLGEEKRENGEMKEAAERRRPNEIELLRPAQNEQMQTMLNGNDQQKTLANANQQRLLVPNALNAGGRRQVTFRDGVNPGQETPSPIAPGNSPGNNIGTSSPNSTPNPYQWLVRSPTSSTGNAPIPSNSTLENQHSESNGKKLPRKISRRTKECRMQEEQASLLQLDHWRLCVLVDTPDCRPGVAELQPRSLDQVVADLMPSECSGTCSNGTSIRVAIRRNFHVHIEWKRQFLFGDRPPMEVLAFCTRGMAAIGVDELMLILELDRRRFSIPEEIEAELFCALEQFEQIFLTCLNSFDDSMDHRMGIRKCANRMGRLYHPLAKKRRTLMGHQAAGLYFHRPHHQHQFGNFHSPRGEFLLGTIIREEELPWAKCSPTRLLLRIGLLTGQYPTPMVNLIREEPAFTREAVGSSVLKVLNDFRGWAYQMTQMAGTAIAVRDNLTEIWLPKLGLDEVRSLVESNRNMIGWAIPELGPAEMEMEVDAHLVCKQTEDGHFCTHIFTQNPDQSRRVTGASFVIFDGALKGGEQYLVTVVEDGLVCRLHADLMEELVKSLLAGDSFLASNSQGHQLSVRFHEMRPNANKFQQQQKGALVSPIDGLALDGQFQYGLQLNRQLNAFNFFQYSTEWALRLATVINILPGKWPSALQPRFFDVCEKLAQQVANTVEPFLQELVAVNQLSICLRVHVDEDAVSYETERWLALPDQHFVWTVTLDEQIIPFLYSLCAWIPSGFHVELQMPILSIRPLPAMNVPIDDQSNEGN